MNDEGSDVFEADAAAGLKELGAADPFVVERVEGTVASLPIAGGGRLSGV